MLTDTQRAFVAGLQPEQLTELRDLVETLNPERAGRGANFRAFRDAINAELDSSSTFRLVQDDATIGEEHQDGEQQ